ncbi:glycosyl hydrolase family 8 [Pelagibacterium halotolerans]|uniref:cellulase n=1 Tax=Pelagibacterium halotolerans (strain DSM 22347 / JCM 15775 / CGMCC 1.7692 / B2) TaxID=1082931 RepID=G4RFY5_PELHB|nr:glycosyl hydrolase family 8 [Pelagibacterium halotolerans]AEQ51028.1 endoglucanase precursor [Pelagibacterium halotolerans B2]
MSARIFPTLVAAAALACFPAAAQDEPMPLSFVHADEWAAYQDAYVRDNGRVVDVFNAEISHSESQGYGMLLAVLAQDRTAFERIWSFTRTELMVRDDGLAAWRWDPSADPHITDINNATDGDILIAYALALAGNGWGIPDYMQEATDIARTVGERLLTEANGLTVILPGAEGFSAAAREDGPVVNPSYWVFEAFAVLADLTPEIDWMSVHDDGLALLDILTADGMPPADWVSMAGETPVPATGFPPEFGYNNVRVPLYVLRANLENTDLLERLGMIFDADHAPAIIDVTTGERIEPMSEAGYRIIGAARACVLYGAPVPADLQTFSPQSYYGATLHLLTLSYLRQRHNQCLVAGSAEGQS